MYGHDEQVSAMVLRFRACDGQQRHLSITGSTILAFVLKIIGEGDRWVSRMLHDHADAKVITAAVIEDEREPGVLVLRVTSLRRIITEALRRGAEAVMMAQLRGERSLFIGKAPVQLERLQMEDHPWAGQASLRDLLSLQSAQADPLIGLTFATPFHHHRIGGVNERLLVPPEITPDTVFGAICARVPAIKPTPIPIDWTLVDSALRRTALVSSMVQTYSYLIKIDDKLPVEHRTLPGVVGSAWFYCAGTEEERRTLHMLAGLAFYLGAGVATTRGMGLVRQLPSVSSESLRPMWGGFGMRDDIPLYATSPLDPTYGRIVAGGVASS